jgi:hypothetical protein
MISNGERFKPDFAERDKKHEDNECYPMNLDKLVLN